MLWTANAVDNQPGPSQAGEQNNSSAQMRWTGRWQSRCEMWPLKACQRVRTRACSLSRAPTRRAARHQVPPHRRHGARTATDEGAPRRGGRIIIRYEVHAFS
eukprot:1970073-Pleurochrysis_carterae.AAC.2